MNPNSLYKLFAMHKEGGWIMEPQSAKQLYLFIKKEPITKILDLGTGIGCSSAMMALALKDSGRKGTIHTVEQTEKCFKISKGLIPKELIPYITFHKSEAVVWKNKDIPHTPLSVFKELPKGPFDFIIVDGPGPWLQGKHFIDLPNGDILRMVKQGELKSGTLVAWDGRIKSLKLLERFYGNNFYLYDQGIDSHFNVLQRKDNPASFSDIKRESMKLYGYTGENSKNTPRKTRHG